MARRLTDTYFVVYKTPKITSYQPDIIYRRVIVIPDDVVNIEDYIYRYIYDHDYIHNCNSSEEANRYITILNIKSL